PFIDETGGMPRGRSRGDGSIFGSPARGIDRARRVARRNAGRNTACPKGARTLSKRLQTPLLDRIASPEDLRRLGDAELPQLAAELREETIDAVSVTGGHLGAGLGVVELTVALHHVFDTPDDKL